MWRSNSMHEAHGTMPTHVAALTSASTSSCTLETSRMLAAVSLFHLHGVCADIPPNALSHAAHAVEGRPLTTLSRHQSQQSQLQSRVPGLCSCTCIEL